MNHRVKGLLPGMALACLVMAAVGCRSIQAVPSAHPVATSIETAGLPGATATSHFLYLPSINSGGSGGQALAETAEPEPTLIPPDPYIEIQSTATELSVGDLITVTGQPVELGLPYYELNVRDEGVQDVESIVRITYEDQLFPLSGSSQVVELVAARGKMDEVVFVLRAKSAGVTTVTILATGEVHSGYPGPATWAGAASGSITIIVK